jgi:hypothetical protein
MRSSTIVALCSLVAGLLLTLALVLVVVAYDQDLADTGEVVTLFSFVAPVSAFAIIGGLLAVRRPSNAVGWLLVAVSVLFAITVGPSTTAAWGLKSGALPKALCEWMDVAGSCWVLALGLIGVQLPLRVPDGRLPSPRWRWFSRITLGLTALAWVGITTTPGRVEGVAGTANPLGSAVLVLLSYALLS